VHKGKTIEGHWHGKACEAYGVQRGGVLRDEEFEALRDNEHTVTHQQITLRMNTTTNSALNRMPTFSTVETARGLSLAPEGDS
jgi:hypothetical protein